MIEARSKGNSSWSKAWASVFGAGLTTPEFARAHAETTVLLAETVEDMQQLSAERRARYESYLPAWWTAVVRPRQDWAAEGTAPTPLLAPSDLDHLAACADLIEDGTSNVAPANPHSVEILQRGVDYLLGVVQEAGDIPATVREQLVADFRHVRWLLDHVDTYGVEHATRAFERTSTRVVTAAAEPSAQGNQGLTTVMFTVLTILVLLLGAAADLAAVVEGVHNIVGLGAGDASVHEIVAEVYEVCVPEALEEGAFDHERFQLPPGSEPGSPDSPRELGPGQSDRSAHDDNSEHTETVEEGDR
ncbi:hypothetical protein [Serinicoccus marinus]|uniref:hypothetical protein n=1 Tax=Serinicoccus marinus TaxID=247333 RepID=UPI00248FB3CC|nr:hypothetical protein [Serinicoccus marinus]